MHGQQLVVRVELRRQNSAEKQSRYNTKDRKLPVYSVYTIWQITD